MKYILRPHQSNDLAAMKENDNGLFIGSTGCGKTFSEAAYAHDYITTTVDPKTIVVVAPTINLIKQTAQEFTKFFHDRNTTFQTITLYSGDEVNIEHDAMMYEQGDNLALKATSIKQVVNHLNNPDVNHMPVIIFVTYKSLYKLASKKAHCNLSIHAVLFDEAHNIYAGKLRPKSGVADVIGVEAEKKFYFTATPTGDPGEETQLFDTSLHGEKLAEHTHYDMTLSGDVLPYRLMFLRDNVLENLPHVRDLTAEQSANVIMLAYEALHEEAGTPTKLLVMLKDTLTVKAIADQMEALHHEGIDVYASGAGTWTGDIINGKEVGRDVFLERLKENDGRNAVILNVSVLGEGVDAAGINGTLFLAGGNEIKISQASGRGARIDPVDRLKVYAGELTPIVDIDKYRKKFGYVIVPNYGVDQTAIASQVMDVIRTLRSIGGYIHINAINVDATGSEQLNTGRKSKIKSDISMLGFDITAEVEQTEEALRLLVETNELNAKLAAEREAWLTQSNEEFTSSFFDEPPITEVDLGM